MEIFLEEKVVLFSLVRSVGVFGGFLRGQGFKGASLESPSAHAECEELCQLLLLEETALLQRLIENLPKLEFEVPSLYLFPRLVDNISANIAGMPRTVRESPISHGWWED